MAASSDNDLVWVTPPMTQSDVFVRRAISFGCLTVVASSAIVYYYMVNDDDKPGKPNTMTTTTTLFLVVALSLTGLMLLIGSGGPRWSLGYKLFGIHAPPVSYRANIVKPGYEPVQEAFVRTLQTGREEGIQFVAYVKGECVVDLSGSTSMGQQFGSDTYFDCWSSSKVVTSVLIAWLVDQGHLDYSAKISDYWPEFQDGVKEELTVRQVMKHSAGLYEPPPNVLHVEDLFAENLPNGNVSKLIEGMECNYPKDPNKFTYHVISRGWILNEIARRVDPQKRTLGQILHDEFTKPLGIVQECYLGLPEELSNPETNPKFHFNEPVPSLFWIICNSVCQVLHIPCSCKWGMNVLFTIFMLHFNMHWRRCTIFINPERRSLFDLMKTPDYLHAESPSSNIVSSGRALAAIANVVSTRDRRFFFGGNKAALEKAFRNEQTKEFFPGANVTFNDGGFCFFSPNTNKAFFEIPGIHSALGWMGYNGSVMVFHPDGDFALAFQPTAINESLPQCRIQSLTKSLADCACRLHGDDWCK